MKRFYLKIKYDIVIMVKNMIEIHVNLKSLEDLFHPFSKNTLNPTLASFIYEECFGYLAKNNIQIFISSNQSFSDKEKETIAKLIHSNFKTELEEEKIKNKLSNTFRTILFITGILILLFVYFIPFGTRIPSSAFVRRAGKILPARKSLPSAPVQALTDIY